MVARGRIEPPTRGFSARGPKPSNYMTPLWPKDQLAALDEELRSISSYAYSWDYPWGQPHPGHGVECTNLLRYNAFFDQLAAHRSERAAMRAAIKLAGTPSP
jgi:hypothetical protein